MSAFEALPVRNINLSCPATTELHRGAYIACILFMQGMRLDHPKLWVAELDPA